MTIDYVLHFSLTHGWGLSYILVIRREDKKDIYEFSSSNDPQHCDEHVHDHVHPHRHIHGGHSTADHDIA